VTVATGVALVALGFVAGWRGMLLAAAATAALYTGAWVGYPDPAEPTTPPCDPSCGISFAGGLMLLIPIALALAGLGAGLPALIAAVRALIRRATRAV
jgi:hypothetical protein